jgi:rod shape-determining protein MreB
LPKICLAIELGTSYTSIFLSGNGIVLHEPSVVAYSDNVVRAVGQRAKEMLGRAPERTIVVCPIVEGVIADFAAAQIMLNQFLSKVIIEKAFIQKIKILLVVPCGLTGDEKTAFEDLLRKCGATETVVIEKAVASAYGLSLPIRTAEGCFVVDIGGGTTDIAAISLSGILEGCTICIGSGHIDAALQKYMLEHRGLQIGHLTAEKVKETVGSLYENDNSSTEATGTDDASKNPGSAFVESKDIAKVIFPYYERIAEAVSSVLNLCPPEICAQALKSGIRLAGGGAMITGAESFFKKRLGVPFALSSESQYACITGAGKLLEDDRLVREIISQN